MNAQKPVHQYPLVRQHMSVSVHTIAANQTLEVAQQLMRNHQVRHLPVLEGGKIVGIVSERDILLVESLSGVNPHEVSVEEAMTQSVFTASPDDPIGSVIETMMARKVGSAVIMEGDHVVGVFTTTDAMHALHEILESR